MNRKILFRCWDAKNNVMAEIDELDGDFDFIKDGDRVRSTASWQSVFNGDYPDLIPMQFTGLQDKNGKDIYESDFVKFHYFYGALGDNDGFVECEHELTGVVKWGEFGWALESIKGEHWKGHTGYEHGEGGAYLVELASMNEGAIHEESFEVIGNQYESPELINNKQYHDKKR